MPSPKKPEMVRPGPRFVVEGAGPAPVRAIGEGQPGRLVRDVAKGDLPEVFGEDGRPVTLLGKATKAAKEGEFVEVRMRRRPTKPAKPAKIFADSLNVAIRTAGVQSLRPGEPVIFSGSEIANIAAGIRSLVAERNMLRKLVKEAYQAGLSQCCGNDDPGEVNWGASPFPTKLERPWDV